MATENVDGGAVREIERLAKAASRDIVTIEDKAYSATPLFDPRKPEPTPEALDVHTLQSVVDYVKGTIDGGYTEKRRRFIHVESPHVVRLLTGVFGSFNQRAVLMEAKAITPVLRFGDFQDPESFNIALQANFEPSTARASVLSVVGGLRAEAVQTLEDDGISQTATARKSVVAIQKVPVPNPVVLRPYRTFAEVEQVESSFVLRLRGGGDGKLPSCALIEADGGAWALTAILRIKAWLTNQLAGACAVYG